MDETFHYSAETGPKNERRRKVRNGAASNELILSSSTARNEEVFPQILDLYVKPGSTVADVTFGQGVFWRQVEHEKYRLLASDLTTGVDCRNLPYDSQEIDCVVFDPPYMHTPGGSAHVGHQHLERC